MELEGQHRALIGLGANLGEPVLQIRHALLSLSKWPGVHRLATSSLYTSAPVGVADGHPDYVNAVALIETPLDPLALLDALQALENRAGRTRPTPLAPRTLDLDLLLFDDLEQRSERLILPHPRMHLRAFVLAPLLEIWPEARIPGRGSAAAWWPAVAGQRAIRIG